MKVKQLPSGSYRIRIMIDGHYFRRMQQRVGLEDVYCFHSTRHYCVSSLHANGLPDVLIYVYRHTISDETAALTDKALNHFDSVTKFVTN